jgi:hypothetical protein
MLLQIISSGHAKTFDIFHSIFLFLLLSFLKKKQVSVNCKSQLASHKNRSASQFGFSGFHENCWWVVLAV